MFFFGRKKPQIDSKFKVGDPVSFRYRGDLTFGYIYTVKMNKKTGAITYDIQVGGQCPYMLYDYVDEQLKLRDVTKK